MRTDQMTDLAEYTGSFAAADLLGAACRLAGVLAESGGALLELSANDQPPRMLRARETDLPGELVCLLNPRSAHAGPTVTASLCNDRGTCILELQRSNELVVWKTTVHAIAIAITSRPP